LVGRRLAPPPCLSIEDLPGTPPPPPHTACTPCTPTHTRLQAFASRRGCRAAGTDAPHRLLARALRTRAHVLPLAFGGGTACGLGSRGLPGKTTATATGRLPDDAAFAASACRAALRDIRTKVRLPPTRPALPLPFVSFTSRHLAAFCCNVLPLYSVPIVPAL